MTKQLEISERLCKMMLSDHQQRTADNVLIHQTLDSLMRKIEDRDKLIAELHDEIRTLNRRLGYK
jgi:Rad3-related DNA helicase